MNNKMYKTGFFILLVINIGLVVLFALGPRPPRPESGIKNEISRELGFTAAQKAAFEQMALNHREAIHTLEKQEGELMGAFFNQLSQTEPNGVNEGLLQEIMQLEKDKIMVTYRHFEDLKGICNEEQLVRFERVIQRILPVLTNSSGRPARPDQPPF
ncbi:hypothetical protein [Marinoscillum sp.]|uniref:hypothetical protein n=1 Tax=Marinoscillum sp. TaxID=2024838 RepID=UPI003BAB9FE6